MTSKKSKPVDQIPRDAVHWRREHFIPVQKSELIERLAHEIDGDDREHFLEFCRLLDIEFRFELQSVLDELKASYAAVNPDPDTQTLAEVSRAEREHHVETLFCNFQTLLTKANFELLSDDEVKEAVGTASDWGVQLSLDFDVFDRLEVFARGDVIGKRVKRGLWRSKEVDVPIYRRVAAIFRLRDNGRNSEHGDPKTVYLKLLKNVPKQDLDMMLPGGRVRMTKFDGGKILLPAISGIVLAIIKIIKKAVVFAVAGVYGLIALSIFILGTLSYGAKSFFGYQRIKAKYEYHLTKSLYFQNLDTNAGVLFRLFDEGHEQEVREAILAYFVLWRRAEIDGLTADQLDRAAEEKLREITQVDVDFEVEDAIAKLERLGLATCTEQGRWKAVRIHRAIKAIDRAIHQNLP